MILASVNTLCCVYRKLDSAIVRMKAPENRSGCSCSNAQNSSVDRAILVQSPMVPHPIMVCGVLVKDPAQMAFPEYDQVVDALPSPLSLIFGKNF